MKNAITPIPIKIMFKRFNLLINMLFLEFKTSKIRDDK